MAFTQTELEFLEENRDLLEEGPKSLETIVSKVLDHPSSNQFKRGKLIFAIVYSIEKEKGFTINISQQFKTSPVEGALLNRTSAKASAAPVLPAMMKAKTKIVYYKIENNKIATETESRFTDLATYKNDLAEGGYNLVILDTPSNRDSVKKAFGGTISFTARVYAKPIEGRGVLQTVLVEESDLDRAKDLIKKQLIDEMVSKFDGMATPVTEVVNYLVDNAKI